MAGTSSSVIMGRDYHPGRQRQAAPISIHVLMWRSTPGLAFAGAGEGCDVLQGRALAQREQGRGQLVAMQPFEPGQREHRGLSGSLRMQRGGYALDARYEQSRKKMRAAVWVFDGDLRHVARCCEDEIGMLDSVFLSVGHADHKGLEWRGVKQLTDFCFHGQSVITAKTKCKPGYFFCAVWWAS